jgi:uncharacterized protein (DUF58 family)
MSVPTGQSKGYLDPKTLQKLENLELVARDVVEGMRAGMHRSPLRGFSTDFAQHRQYVPGDDIKHIDWRVYGRTSRYYVKLYEAETNLKAYMLLDASSSMHYGSGAVDKLEYAKYMAAALSYIIVQQHDSAGLGVFDSELRSHIEPQGTKSIIHTIDRELRQVEGEPRTDVGAILHEFARRISRRAVVVLFSDLFDETDAFLAGLDHLRFQGHNVMVLHTMDPDELTFPFSGTCRFEGLEGESPIITQPQRIREDYVEEVRKFVRAIRDACRRSQVDYMLVDTSQPVDMTLNQFLRGQAETNLPAERSLL